MRLAPGHILVEQLKLIYASMPISILPMIPVFGLLFWVLKSTENMLLLAIWLIASVGFSLGLTVYSQRLLRRGFTVRHTQRLVRNLAFTTLLSGFAWGALTWVVLDSANEAGRIVVICVMSGFLCGAMSLLSPVLPIFLIFAVSMMGTVTLKLWLLHQSAYHALGAIVLLYLMALIGQARNTNISMRAAIELRFENLDLIAKTQQALQAAEQERLTAIEAQKKAEQANTAKSKFLAAASHDLRQPVHAQGLFLEVLEHTNLSAHQQKLLGSVSAAREATASMLNVLLDFSRIEAGVVAPQMQTFALQPLLNKLEREYAQQADAKGLSYRSRETSLLAHSDPALVEMVLRNFISNAIRYTEFGGLLVTVRRRQGQALLQVGDTGIGIAPEQQQAVFQEFHQLNNSERDRNKGLGLGLAIAQGLARTLGHPIGLASVPRRGSVFSLTLPLAASVEAVSLSTKHPHASSQDEPVDAGSSDHGLVPKLPADNALLLDARILVIDDESTVREGMVALLGQWGCVCLSVGSIEEALAQAAAFAPQLIVSDYRLRQQRNGLEAISSLRQLLGAGTPAILITGDTAPDRLRETLGSGMRLLHKPVAPEQLRSVVLKELAAFPTAPRAPRVFEML